jgi:UDP-N-acetylglucosamine--N-acetylmuramyl-(pentapeptide) pyrophosphoryl-undecaprenol N-acetylglucosamine transferase
VLRDVDLVVARAGGSIFEVAAAGKPSILIPSPNVTADHQTANARHLEAAGAAIVIPDAELTPERLDAEVRALLADPERMRRMGEAALAWAKPDAAAVIADDLLTLHRR